MQDWIRCYERSEHIYASSAKLRRSTFMPSIRHAYMLETLPSGSESHSEPESQQNSLAAVYQYMRPLIV
jgi:hypothetical protein